MIMTSTRRGKVVSYNKWGYIFLIPFVVVYLLFSFVPLISTIYNSFFENYRSGLTQIGPNFIGLENFKAILTSGEVWVYAQNTMIMWLLGFVPQILISLLLGAWFSDPSLQLKCQGFFKTVIYLPNLIMASAFAMLFFTLFSDGGHPLSVLVFAAFYKHHQITLGTESGIFHHSQQVLVLQHSEADKDGGAPADLDRFAEQSVSGGLERCAQHLFFGDDGICDSCI